MKALLLYCTLFFLPVMLYAQDFQRQILNDYVTRFKNDRQSPAVSYKVHNDRLFTSISIKYEGKLGNTTVIANERKYSLVPDEHADGAMSESALLIFAEPVSEIAILPDDAMRILHEITAIHAPAITIQPQRIKNEDSCDEPAMIDQSTWRSGLPSPSGSRSFSTIRNIIVHHAASDNDLTDYTNVVRNIYLFHTQDRGWSDIGYNYLIAQNGDIYAGRDPQNGDQDEVIGAHFCGRNSNTMGVCLLGNLSLVPPTEEAINSLEDLITWKTFTDEMNPLGINAHPLNAALPVIAGHRDGCATECPGNLAYPELRMIRNNVDDQVTACREPEPPEEPERIFAFGPNPTTSDVLTVSLPENVLPEDIWFTDLNGKQFTPSIASSDEVSVRLNFSEIPKGVYIMRIDVKDFSATEKIIRL